MFCKEKIISAGDYVPWEYIMTLDDLSVDVRVLHKPYAYATKKCGIYFETENYYIAITQGNVELQEKSKIEHRFEKGYMQYEEYYWDFEYKKLLFVGEYIRNVEIINDDLIVIKFSNFEFPVHFCDSENDIPYYAWIWYDTPMQMIEYNKHLTRKCDCGGNGMIYWDTDSKGDDSIFVRCENCHIATKSNKLIENAINAWNIGAVECNHILPEDDWSKALSEPIEYINAGKFNLSFWSEWLVECEELVIKTKTRTLLLQLQYISFDDDARFAMQDITGREKLIQDTLSEYYAKPKKSEYITFHKVLYENGDFWGLEFKLDDYYLQALTSDCDLIFRITQYPYDSDLPSEENIPLFDNIPEDY